MTSYDFVTTTHGKWILAGEHAVLRGHEALVFPVQEKELSLAFTHANHEVKATFSGEQGLDLQLPFQHLIEYALTTIGQENNNIRGHFHIDNHIPIGVGMGASAALCVAVARFINYYFNLNEDVHEFAKKLEHLFHGKSSGLDVAGVQAPQGLCFQQGSFQPITIHWQPLWFLSYSKEPGNTKSCIDTVNTLWKTQPEKAQSIDTQMMHSVSTAKEALQESSSAALTKLIHAIEEASACFKEWGLITKALSHHMHMLKEAGALAVKPTGSGGGGYVLSLWDSAPDVDALKCIRV